jgi:hypothetical protein
MMNRQPKYLSAFHFKVAGLSAIATHADAIATPAGHFKNTLAEMPRKREMSA